MAVLILIVLPCISFAQVILRDTTVTWQHHRFELNEDGSMKDFTTSDSDIELELFTEAKVIENDFIRLVIVPEYGGRVLSFIYKPTNHEYLYQSEVGSPYGIGDGNFYYDWLMVYGGIFPTFPEPEHGKTWFLPWDYSVIQDTDEVVTVRMEYTDNSSYSGAPGGFNNGVTNITCRVDVTVYQNSTLWDYDVTLINNEPNNINYEYWTCTTLTPGSDIGDTGAPLNSEIIVPVDEYFAGWSPGAWIGNFNGRYDMENIKYLSEWDNMGIAYAYNLNDTYWGVINHENEEGIFRISENVETQGMKLWTWGKNNIDNDLHDFSNGGADNYIELWAGVSNSFFSDAVLAANEQKSWTESYCATVGLSSILNINDEAATNLIWKESEQELTYQLNTFSTDQNYSMHLYVDGVTTIEIMNQAISFEPLGSHETMSLASLNLSSGEHLVKLDIINEANQLVLEASKFINVQGPLGNYVKDMSMKIVGHSQNSIQAILPEDDDYFVKLISLDGRILFEDRFIGSSSIIKLPNTAGLYILKIYGKHTSFSKKLVWR